MGDMVTGSMQQGLIDSPCLYDVLFDDLEATQNTFRH